LAVGIFLHFTRIVGFFPEKKYDLTAFDHLRNSISVFPSTGMGDRKVKLSARRAGPAGPTPVSGRT
jgi:hypothetical protein